MKPILKRQNKIIKHVLLKKINSIYKCYKCPCVLIPRFNSKDAFGLFTVNINLTNLTDSIEVGKMIFHFLLHTAMRLRHVGYIAMQCRGVCGWMCVGGGGSLFVCVCVYESAQNTCNPLQKLGVLRISLHTKG